MRGCRRTPPRPTGVCGALGNRRFKGPKSAPARRDRRAREPTQVLRAAGLMRCERADPVGSRTGTHLLARLVGIQSRFPNAPHTHRSHGIPSRSCFKQGWRCMDKSPKRMLCAVSVCDHFSVVQLVEGLSSSRESVGFKLTSTVALSAFESLKCKKMNHAKGDSLSLSSSLPPPPSSPLYSAPLHLRLLAFGVSFDAECKHA